MSRSEPATLFVSTVSDATEPILLGFAYIANPSEPDDSDTHSFGSGGLIDLGNDTRFS